MSLKLFAPFATLALLALLFATAPVWLPLAATFGAVGGFIMLALGSTLALGYAGYRAGRTTYRRLLRRGLLALGMLGLVLPLGGCETIANVLPCECKGWVQVQQFRDGEWVDVYVGEPQGAVSVAPSLQPGGSTRTRCVSLDPDERSPDGDRVPNAVGEWEYDRADFGCGLVTP